MVAASTRGFEKGRYLFFWLQQFLSVFFFSNSLYANLCNVKRLFDAALNVGFNFHITSILPGTGFRLSKGNLSTGIFIKT